MAIYAATAVVSFELAGFPRGWKKASPSSYAPKEMLSRSKASIVSLRVNKIELASVAVEMLE